MQSIWGPLNEGALSYVAPDGSKPIVVCTPNEYFSDVTARVKAVGGSANVVLAEVNRFRVMVLESIPGEVTSESEGVNADLSMGMLFLRMSSNRNKRGLIHIAGVSVNSGSREFAYA